jgi:putative ribosome biogenesis GTPase RsgA
MTEYANTPQSGDTTVIWTYSDQITVTTTTTVTITTTTTTTTYFSDGTDSSSTGIPVVTQESSQSASTNVVEDLTKRKTLINSVLQANNPPIIFIAGTIIEGEGSHDHLQFDGCALDTSGPFTGRKYS